MTATASTHPNPPVPRPRSRLIGSLLGVLAIALTSLVLTTPAAAQYSSGCAVDCLFGKWATPTPGGAAFLFRTTVPTKVELRIAEAGGAWGQKPVVRFIGGYQYRTQHNLQATGLRGGIAYQYQVTVRDSSARIHREYGTFTSLNRSVEAHVDQVFVLDDSDAMGQGEITMHLKLGAHTKMYYYFDHLVGSGGILNPLWSRTEIATGDQTSLKVQLIDNDAECSIAVPCDGGSMHLHPNWGTGTNNDADWGTASLMVDTGPSAPTGSIPFMISSPSHSRIKFVASGWYRVIA